MFSILFTGIFLVCLGCFFLWNYYRDENREYVLVSGKVIRYDCKRKSHGQIHTRGYVPVFEYFYAGKVYQRAHRISSSKYGKGMRIEPNSKYQIGDTVELRVYVEKPEYAIVNDKNNIRMPLYVGIPATLVGILILGGSMVHLFSL